MASNGRDAVRSDDFLLHRVTDQIPAMLAYWDSNQRCCYANGAYEYWLGVSPESLIGKHLSEILSPLYQLDLPYIEGALGGERQDLEREVPDPAGGPPRHGIASYLPDVVDGVVRGCFVLDVSEIKRGELAPGAPVLGLRKDGPEFPAEATIAKLEVGGTRQLTIAPRDITERGRSELEQRILAEAGVVFAASLDYRQTLDRIARLIVRYLADLCIIDMLDEQTGVVRLTAVHADPALASVCEELGALHLEPRHTLAWSALETKQVQVFRDLSAELLESRAQDPEHYRLIRAVDPRSALVVPVLSGAGVLGALVLVSSRPGRYEARDVGLATELARRAALAIENARLLEVERRARKARDEVLAIVAHDVRTPLSSILLAAESLEDQLEKAGVAIGERQVDSIQRAVRRANRLIDDLLDLTRIEAGAFSVELGRLDARPIAADAVSAQRPLAAAASIQLRLEPDDGELPAVWADRDRLLQVLENLIGNAIKFTPRGGSITVGVAPRSDEILFSVTDTGPGISAESRSHVFDRFWQASGAERRGAGLGLAICKGLVEAHGGRIWVESAPSRGSTFWFTIPAAPRASDRLLEAAPQGA